MAEIKPVAKITIKNGDVETQETMSLARTVALNEIIVANFSGAFAGNVGLLVGKPLSKKISKVSGTTGNSSKYSNLPFEMTSEFYTEKFLPVMVWLKAVQTGKAIEVETPDSY
jgi:hypothetical protein